MHDIAGHDGMVCAKKMDAFSAVALLSRFEAIYARTRSVRKRSIVVDHNIVGDRRRRCIRDENAFKVGILYREPGDVNLRQLRRCHSVDEDTPAQTGRVDNGAISIQRQGFRDHDVFVVRSRTNLDDVVHRCRSDGVGDVLVAVVRSPRIHAQSGCMDRYRRD